MSTEDRKAQSRQLAQDYPRTTSRQFNTEYIPEYNDMFTLDKYTHWRALYIKDHAKKKKYD